LQHRVTSATSQEALWQAARSARAVCASWIESFILIAPIPDNPRLFVREQGRCKATPLLVASL
jgi:hypothetical protein